MNLVLGDVVETIYVVDEDDDDKEDIRVCFTFTSHTISRYVLTSASDRYQEVGDVICSRYVFSQPLRTLIR